jgi:hypothetical protein
VRRGRWRRGGRSTRSVSLGQMAAIGGPGCKTVFGGWVLLIRVN